jgi:hypothetical protein
MENNGYRESDLYAPVRAYLESQGFKVKGEVNHCDVTAVKDDFVIVVEMKKALNLDVILQAVQRQRIADSVYIGIPKKHKAMRTKKWHNTCHLLRRLELGLILVSLKDDSSRVEVFISPEPFNRGISKSRKRKQRIMLVNEFSNRHGDYNTGGVTGRKIVTAYREKAIHIAVLLKTHGRLSIKQLKELGADAGKTSSILQKNFYGWFDRISKGVYRLTSLGIKEIDSTYKDLASLYKKQ